MLFILASSLGFFCFNLFLKNSLIPMLLYLEYFFDFFFDWPMNEAQHKNKYCDHLMHPQLIDKNNLYPQYGFNT